jgi:peptide/nickel transport system substrate-binding protein
MRHRFVLLVGLMATFLLLLGAACGTKTVEVEKIVQVEKEVLVEVEKIKEVVVEREVVVEVEKEVVRIATPTPIPAKPTSAVKGGSLVVAQSAAFDTLDGADTRSIEGRNVLYQMFDTLVGITRDAGAFTPQLAESWSVSGDGKVYTFKLREGVKFTDGTPFNAQAVKWNFDRQYDMENPNRHGALLIIFRIFMTAYIDKIEAPDATTFRLVLNKPFGPFMEAIAMQSGLIASPTSFEKNGKDALKNPVTTGKFKFIEWKKGQRIVMERNDDYWGNVWLDRLTIVPIPEAAVQIAALSSGNVDVLLGTLTADAVKYLENDSSLTVNSFVYPHYWAVHLSQREVDGSTGYAPFQNLLVRQALNYATNKQSIVTDILKGTASVSHANLGPAYGKWQNANVTQYPYNPDKAKELLAKAGYADGLEFTLLVPASGAGQQDARAMATSIQADWAKIGVKANLKVQELVTHWTQTRAGKFQASTYGWSSIMIDPYNHMTNNFRSGRAINVMGFSNAAYDALVDEAAGTADPAKRKELYDKAQEILATDAAAVFVNHGKTYALTSSRVQDFAVNIVLVPQMGDVWVLD